MADISEQAPKKKLLKVKAISGTKPTTQGYDNLPTSAIMFSMAGRIENDERAQCTSWAYCRETLIREVSENIKGVKSGKVKLTIDQIDPNRLRLLILFKNTPAFKEKLFSGKRALNLLERAAGWEGRSVITTVNHEVYDKNVWLVTGPSEWMAYPQMLSLATWILRLATGYGPLDTTNLSSFEKQLKGLYSSKGDSSSDLRYAGSFWNRAYILAKYYKDVFAKIAGDDAWSFSDAEEVGVYGGMMTLVESPKTTTYYKSVVAEAHNNFIQLCKNHLPRKLEDGEKS